MPERGVWWAGVLALVLLAAWPAAAAAAEPEREITVAVFPLEPRGAELAAAEVEALSSALGEKVRQRMGVRLVEWREVAATLRSRGLEMCLDRSCQIDVERTLAVDYGLAVVVNKMGDFCMLNARLYPAGASASLRTALARGDCTPAALRQGFDKIVAALAAMGELEPASAAADDPPAAATAGRPASEPVPQPAQDQAEKAAASAEPAAGPGRTKSAVAESQAKAERYVISGGGLYAPAPLVFFDRRGSVGERKIPDFYGPLATFDWIFNPHLYLGGQLGLFFADGGRQTELSARFGGRLGLGDSLDATGWLGLGFHELKIRNDVDLEDTYSGVHALLGLGLRTPLTETMGLGLDLAGYAGQELGELQDIVVLRLQLQVVVTYALDR